MSGVRLAPYEATARSYDALLGSHMLPLFLRNFQVLSRRHGMRVGRVADVGCGSGAFVMALRRAGIRAVGVDRSRRMVTLARRRARQGRVGTLPRSRPAPCSRRWTWSMRSRDEGFRVQDLRHLRLARPVDLITCNFDVLNYLLSEPELRRAFRAFSRNLVPGGHLLFDMIVSAPRTSIVGRYARVVSCEGRPALWIIDRLPNGVRRVTVWLRRPGGGSSWLREVHVQRAHPTHRILRALRSAGLRVLGVHDAYTLGTLRRDRTRAVFVAERSRGTLRVGPVPHSPGSRS